MNDETKEILDITQEEAAEVIVAISKVSRFGFDNIKPGQSITNREHLEVELGDVLAMIDILVDKKIVNRDSIEKAIQAKREKLKIWSNIEL